jgi:hypothetical protein
MTSEEYKKIDAHFAELTKNEVSYLKEMGISPNEHGAYAFSSADGSQMIALDMFMASYKSWLIENKIVREPR